MKKGKLYKLTLTDGEVVEGVYIDDRRGFYILKRNNKEIPIRYSSVVTKAKVE